MTFIFNTPILNINSSKVAFRSNNTAYLPHTNANGDSYASNPLYRCFSDKEAITEIAKSNPKVMSILKEYKIPLRVNYAELEKLKHGHLNDTRVIAAKIYSALPPGLKSEVNPVDLQQAAVLHDYGKVLIPDKILNKNGKLTPQEQEIMSLHSELGYELLKSKGINQNVLNLVKYHHQTPQGTGYPEIDNGYVPDISAQILSLADKFSALCEERSYKQALNSQEAINILRQEVDSGQVSPEVFRALVQAA